MFSIFDIIIIVLASVSWLLAYSGMDDESKERLKTKETLVFLAAFVLCFTISMYWLRFSYFKSVYAYWICVIGIGIFGPLGLSIIGGIIGGVVIPLLKVEDKVQAKSLPIAIMSLIFSCILLGISIYKFPHMMAQTEIEYQDKQLARARKHEQENKIYREWATTEVNNHIRMVANLLPSIYSEQSYKYKFKKIYECKENLQSAYYLSQDSITKRQLKQAEVYLLNGTTDFYTQIYNWAEEDSTISVNKFALELRIEDSIYDTGDILEIKTDNSEVSKTRLLQYMDDINPYLDSVNYCLSLISINN